MAKKKKKNGGFEVANQITSQETEKAWGNNYTKQQNHVLFMAYTKFYTQKPLFFVSPPASGYLRLTSDRRWKIPPDKGAGCSPHI